MVNLLRRLSYRGRYVAWTVFIRPTLRKATLDFIPMAEAWGKSTSRADFQIGLLRR